ncbi:hypothetical protein N7470_003840 [Penicillium chermesinum]|nr:hypothetical protein N7470_003840 [Penicillium chermesinum]
MDAFVSRKRVKVSASEVPQDRGADSEESTDVKLAMLVSLHPECLPDDLLDVLVACEGSVEEAASLLQSRPDSTAGTPRKRAAPPSFLGVQSSLTNHVMTKAEDGSLKPFSETAGKKSLATQKGKTLHLFDPQDIASHTPCTIIHNFLPADEANVLLEELLQESQHFTRHEFQLFSRTVKSPHSACVYVSTPEEQQQQISDYTYGGTYRAKIRQAPRELRSVSRKVQRAVNEEIQKRIREVYPDGKKLKHQSAKEWRPNAAFVNCYDGPGESVGYHSDDLTYLGPHPVIGSLSLGVEREFRIRRVVARDEEAGENAGSPARHPRPEIDGSISPTGGIVTPCTRGTPRDVAVENLQSCGVQKNKQETRGRYMWMCYAGYDPGKPGCSFFQWAEFDDDGDPVWEEGRSVDLAPKLVNFASQG